MIVEVPVARTPEKTQQLVNTHVQHVVDTVEVEKPEITELTVQRKKPIIQEKINQVPELTVQRKEPIIQEKMNQVTKPIEFPQAQFLNKAGDMLVGMQRHVPVAQTVQKAMEVPPLQSVDKVSNIPVVAPRQISPMVQTVQKTIETQQLQCIDNVSDVPVVSVVPAPQVQVSEKTVEISQLQAAEKIVETRGTQTIQSTQTSEKLGTAPVCRSTQAEIVEAVEIGAIPHTESASSLLPSQHPSWGIHPSGSPTESWTFL